jgi:hypothetical protein
VLTEAKKKTETVYGSAEKIQAFVKKMTGQTAKE